MSDLKQVPQNGPLISKDLNKFMDSVHTTMDRLTTKVIENETAIAARQRDSASSQASEGSSSFQRRYEENVDLAFDLINIINTVTKQKQVFSFFDSQHIHYLIEDGGGDTEYPVANRLQLSSTFGQSLLPYNGIKSMFWSANADVVTESIYTPAVTSIYTELSTVAANSVEVSDIRRAVDGSSKEPYLIRASYDIDTDVEEVRFEVVVQVPQVIARQCNMLTIETAPSMRCSIEDIKYSDTTVVPNNPIPNLPTITKNKPIYATQPKRFLFDSVFMTSFSVTLTSKSYTIENGRKVFYVGLRELGLYLVDWDQTWTLPVGAVFTNNGFFLKLEVPQVAGVTPSNTYLNEVDIKTSPTLASTETVGVGTSTGVRVRLFEDDTFSSVAADSVGGGFPFTIVADREYVWLAVELDKNNTSGTIPVLETLIASYTVRS